MTRAWDGFLICVMQLDDKVCGSFGCFAVLYSCMARFALLLGMQAHRESGDSADKCTAFAQEPDN